MVRITIAAALVALLPLPAAAQACAPLLKTEADGKVSAGSKSALIEAVRSGAPVRVGWEMDFERDGAVDLIHWAEPIFLTVFEGEVFAQIPEIHRQEPLRSKADVRLSKAEGSWRGLLGSAGFLEGRYNGEPEPRRTPVRIIWCAV